MSKRSFIGLIPVRLRSKRLKNKPLLNLLGLPLFVHVYRRAKLSSLLNDVIVCCDDKKIFEVAKKFNVKCIMTKKTHKNGTERIAEAYNKIKKKYNLIVDIQGDEPLLNPKHIDRVINYHLKNFKSDIILPSLKIKKMNKVSIVKVIKTSNDDVLYLSRKDVPYEFNKKKYFFYKHLSIISFKPRSLKKYSCSKKTTLEKTENIELLRALEIGLKIKSLNLRGDSFSVDIKPDLTNAKKNLIKDKIFNQYKNL
tara:strand:- start:910 stop:1668 length:759 start_codon:yes stop_codon:yes gene_type:complete